MSRARPAWLRVVADEEVCDAKQDDVNDAQVAWERIAECAETSLRTLSLSGPDAAGFRRIVRAARAAAESSSKADLGYSDAHWERV